MATNETAYVAHIGMVGFSTIVCDFHKTGGNCGPTVCRQGLTLFSLSDPHSMLAAETGRKPVKWITPHGVIPRGGWNAGILRDVWLSQAFADEDGGGELPLINYAVPNEDVITPVKNSL